VLDETLAVLRRLYPYAAIRFVDGHEASAERYPIEFQGTKIADLEVAGTAPGDGPFLERVATLISGYCHPRKNAEHFPRPLSRAPGCVLSTRAPQPPRSPLPRHVVLRSRVIAIPRSRYLDRSGDESLDPGTLRATKRGPAYPSEGLAEPGAHSACFASPS
jgi:hypothetical protein